MFDYMDMSFDDAVANTETAGPYIPDAGECMRCGQCVSSCPTFRLFQIDAETPRRRIRTIGKILLDKQPISAEERMHLNNCVQCRACEPACPSKMAYGQLFDQAQAHISNTPGWLGKLALTLIVNKRWLQRLMPLLAFYLKSGLQKPLRRSGLLKLLGLANAEALLGKPVLPALAYRYRTGSHALGRVALFTGCVTEHFDRDTLMAAIKLLNAIGYEVLVPPEQGCCGAVHQHNGQSATTLINNNIQVFNALQVNAVIHTATGCGAMLNEYQSEAAQLFKQRLYDINDFFITALAH